MKVALFVFVAAVILWNVAYYTGKSDLGSWAILVGLAWGAFLGACIAVYSRVIDR